jgi:hypothetical protein
MDQGIQGGLVVVDVVLNNVVRQQPAIVANNVNNINNVNIINIVNNKTGVKRKHTYASDLCDSKKRESRNNLQDHLKKNYNEQIIDSHLINGISNKKLRTACENIQKNVLIDNNNNNDNNRNRNNNNMQVDANNNMQEDANIVDILIEGQDVYKNILKSLKARRVIFSKKQRNKIIEIVEKCSIFMEGKHAEDTEEWDPYDQVGMEETVKYAVLDIRRTRGYETLRWQQVLKMLTYLYYFQ